MRLDQAVAARHPEISRRRARILIAEHRVLVNDRPVAVASREVSDRDRIAIVQDVPELAIVKETRDWIAVDKPSGLATQPVRERNQRSLEELLRVRYGNVFVVHRIDTQTSGIVVFARHREAAAQLSQLFASRAIRKTYLAVVEGAIESELTIESPIGGKDAHTLVRPLRRLDDRTLVEAEIFTGRTHQIRIHLRSIERPVVGDRRYGSSMPAPRMLLHAWKLAHEEFGTLIAPVPGDFPAL
ncbi:MAG: RluA family pseudouridine synthase [Acidobacteria bacterium]|nr:RluA family pseudouridine synthase [Acidobacteriota bacterium]MBV9475810.1 RluA family pseudouridine synthase [Acidobacteriota bacterium]